MSCCHFVFRLFSQEEALEQVASEGRCTDVSLGMFIPPDIPYPKHPPLDNPSSKAMAIANQMMAELEIDQSSQHESSPPQSSPSDSTLPCSPQSQSPGSVISPDPISKPPQTLPNTMVGYPNSPADFSHMSSPSPGASQFGMIEPSCLASSWETSPACDVYFMKQPSFQVNVANGVVDRFVLETMHHTLEMSGPSIRELPDDEIRAVGFSDLQPGMFEAQQMRSSASMPPSNHMSPCQHAQSMGTDFPTINNRRNVPATSCLRQPVVSDINKSHTQVAYTERVNALQGQPDHEPQAKPTMAVKPNVRYGLFNAVSVDGWDCSYPHLVGPIQAQTVVAPMQQIEGHQPSVEQLLFSEDVLDDLHEVISEDMMASGPTQMVSVSLVIQWCTNSLVDLTECHGRTQIDKLVIIMTVSLVLHHHTTDPQTDSHSVSAVDINS